MRRLFNVAPSVVALSVLLCLATSVAAQGRRGDPPRPARAAAGEPAVAVRPFFMFTEQRFGASESFKAVFGGNVEPFIGAGAQLAFRNGLFVDTTFSRFKKVGERAFRFNDETFRLGIPLTVTVTPIEITGGLRFGSRRQGKPAFLVPFVGGGVGRYSYHESSKFSVGGEDVDQSGIGFLAVGGAEFRVQRWISATTEIQFSHVGGVLGDAGLSKDAGETDLGGVSARFRVMIGR
jgi:hypothetical protein